MGIVLENGQIEKLIAWFGYGDFQNSNIVFMGTEEGLNFKRDIYKSIEVRCDKFGMKQINWLDKSDRKNGYWEDDVKMTRNTLDNLPIVSGNTKSNGIIPMICYQARMLLSLETNDLSWLTNSHPNNDKKIKEYIEHYAGK